MSKTCEKHICSFEFSCPFCDLADYRLVFDTVREVTGRHGYECSCELCRSMARYFSSISKRHGGVK